MPVPKKRRSPSKRKIYYNSWKVTSNTNTSTCANCGAPVMAHVVCDVCGFYKGKKVMTTKVEKSAARKARKKEEENKK